MIRLILIISVLISIADMREKPPSDWIVETDSSDGELYNPERGVFFLLEKKVKAIVEGPYVEIKSIYTYKNNLDHLAEAQFEFPQSEYDIFHQVEIKHENQDAARLIFDEVNFPKKEYPQQKLFTRERFSYKEIQAGNLQARETVEVIFTVMRPLKVQLNQFYELTIRPYHTPRFTNFHWELLKTNCNIQVELKSERPFDILANPTHHSQPKLSNQTDSLSEITTYKAFYNITLYNVHWLSQDFKIYFASSDFNAPQTIMATHPFNPHDHSFMFSLIPDMNYFPSRVWGSPLKKEDSLVLQNLDNLESFLKLKKLTVQSDDYFFNEYLFVLDRSDSMKGPRLENLKRRLNHDLDFLSGTVSSFSILSFGSSSQLHWKTPESKAPEDTREIMKWVETLEADMGDKDLLGALKFAFEEYKWTSPQKNVIILTDGQVSNVDEIIQLVQANSHFQKVCAIGAEEKREDILQKIGVAGGCPTEIPWWSEYFGERPLDVSNSAFRSPSFNLAYEITCENEQKQVVYQEEDGYDEISKDKVFTKWVTVNNIPNLKSCKAKIFYYSQYRCSSFSEEIEIFRSQATQSSAVWHKVAEHSRLHNELETEEIKRKFMVNHMQEEDVVPALSKALCDPKLFESQETTQQELICHGKPRSLYDIYQEQFYNLRCYDPKRPLLTGTALSKPLFESAHEERVVESSSSRNEDHEEESFFSFKIICIAFVFTLLFVGGLFLLF